MTHGGEGGDFVKLMTKERYALFVARCSIAQKGIKFTDAHKEKLSKAKYLNPTALSGKDNGRARKIAIYNSEDILLYEAHGNFAAICAENNLQRSALYHTLCNNTTIKKGDYAGWYARYK